MNKIEHQTLNDRAYDEIKRGLMAATFHPGQPLIIRSLAETYGISTTPVREALQRLVAERLLVLQPNRSIVVPELDVNKFKELRRIRCTLEGLAVELAAESRPGKAPLRLLNRMVREMDGAVAQADYDAYRKVNQQFHFALYEQAGSPRLLQIIQDIWGEIGPYMMELFSNDIYGPKANDEHKSIMEALEAGDGVRARTHIVADIMMASEVLVPRIEEIERQREARATKVAQRSTRGR